MSEKRLFQEEKFDECCVGSGDFGDAFDVEKLENFIDSEIKRNIKEFAAMLIMKNRHGKVSVSDIQDLLKEMKIK